MVVIMSLAKCSMSEPSVSQCRTWTLISFEWDIKALAKETESHRKVGHDSCLQVVSNTNRCKIIQAKSMLLRAQKYWIVQKSRGRKLILQ